jgi:hypothetical protein
MRSRVGSNQMTGGAKYRKETFADIADLISRVRSPLDSVEEVREPNEGRGQLLRATNLFRPAVDPGLVSAWPACEGSGRLPRGGTRHGRHLVPVVAVGPARECA